MQRVIEEVFVVNRIEFATVDHIQSVSEFKDRDPGGFQNSPKPADQVINLVYVRDDVVGYQDISELAFARQLLGIDIRRNREWSAPR